MRLRAPSGWMAAGKMLEYPTTGPLACYLSLSINIESRQHVLNLSVSVCASRSSGLFGASRLIIWVQVYRTAHEPRKASVVTEARHLRVGLWLDAAAMLQRFEVDLERD